MNNLAEKNIDLALDKAEEHFEIMITVMSIKHDCHVSYLLSSSEIELGYTNEVLRDLTCQLQDFIKEKLNATSEGKESKDKERIQ